MNYSYFDEVNYKREMDAAQEAADKLTRNFAKIELLELPGLATREFCIAASIDGAERPTDYCYQPSRWLREKIDEGLNLRFLPKSLRKESEDDVLKRLFFPSRLTRERTGSFLVGLDEISPEDRKCELEIIQKTVMQVSYLVVELVHDFEFADGVFTVGKEVTKRLRERNTYKPKGKQAEKAIELIMEIAKDFDKLAELLPGFNFNNQNGAAAWKDYFYRQCKDDGSFDETHLWYWGNIPNDTETRYKERVFI